MEGVSHFCTGVKFGSWKLLHLYFCSTSWVENEHHPSPSFFNLFPNSNKGKTTYAMTEAKFHPQLYLNTFQCPQSHKLLVGA